MANDLLEKAMDEIIAARNRAPHEVLGPHPLQGGKTIAVRAFLPRASRVSVVPPHSSPGKRYPMRKIREEGMFEALIPAGEQPGVTYRLHAVEVHGDETVSYDPYAFPSSSLSDLDLHLFGEGKHYRIFEKLGAHPRSTEGIPGVNFAVWAPNAERVSVVGEFNRWDGRCHPMRFLGGPGVWELFIPGLAGGTLYKFEIRARNGDFFLKADPFAFYTEVPPGTASIVYDLAGKYTWHDESWMNKRRHGNAREGPMSVYEVHLGSWKRRPGDGPLTYREMTAGLVPYVKRTGFTHVEFLPLAEHPYEPSWGYQVSNYYAPTSRFGRPEDLMRLIDILHQNGIGTLLDWVPSHFPKDAHGMAWFDGTCLYEHADPRKGEHRDWGTLAFNHGRNEVQDFLIANALFWLEKYHFDGLRVDAVASMLYLDYARKAGEWIPNKYGGKENLEAIDFLRHMNTVVRERFPSAVTIAEESTAWPAVSGPADRGGLGFHFKWNMGWTHDVLDYFSRDPRHRKEHHRKLTFGLEYAFNENFILSLSHDDVVHLKRSMLNKMPGEMWQKFANLRLLYLLLYAHPGKKLLFMGDEFGQRGEWNHAAGLEWHLLDHEQHRGLHRWVCDLNRFYRSERALYEVDFRRAGFEWLDAERAEENILAFARKAKDPRNCLFFALNFSSAPRPYRMGVPFPVLYRESLNSDAEIYGGGGGVLPGGGLTAEETPSNGHDFSLSLTLPPLGGLVLKPAPLADVESAHRPFRGPGPPAETGRRHGRGRKRLRKKKEGRRKA